MKKATPPPAKKPATALATFQPVGKPEGNAAPLPATAGSTGALVAAMPSHLQAYVTQAVQQIGAIGNDEASLWRASDMGEQMEMAGRLIAGRANLELSTRVDNRKLAEELRTRGKNRAGFYYSIDVYKAYEALPDAQKVEALAGLGYTKSRALLSWSPEERLALVSDEEVRGLTLDAAAAMPSREFEEWQKAWRNSRDEELRKAHARAESAEGRAEAAKNELQRERSDAAKRARESGLAPFAQAAREDAIALTEEMDVCLDGLGKLVNVLSSGTEAARHPNDAGTAAGTLYHALLGVQARSQALLIGLGEQFSEQITAVPRSEQLLNPGEVERALAQRQRLLGRAEVEAHNRKADRENSRAGRKGRTIKKREAE